MRRGWAALLCASLLPAACGGSVSHGSKSDAGAGGSSAGGATSTGGGTGTVPKDGPCALNSDCTAPLFCVFAKCEVQCRQSRDCATNERCVLVGDAGAGVCQLQTETQCNFNTDCVAPLVCAIDRVCRTQCAGNRDCPQGQTCSAGVCGNPLVTRD